MPLGDPLAAHVHPPRPIVHSAAHVRDVLLAGPMPCALVAVAGSTLGFFAWMELAIRSGEVPLLLSIALGGALALWFWQWYARFFSQHTGVTLSRSLFYDALSWAPFLLLWLSLALPPAFTHGGARALAICAFLFCAAKVAFGARFNQSVREVLVDFVATRTAIIVIAELAAVIIGQRAGQHVQESSHLLLDVWGRWDAVHYLSIAASGYHGTDMAFFPLFPLLIHILGAVLANHLIAGLLISNSCFFVGLLFLYRLLEREYDRPVARRAVFYASIFPSAFFFSAVYTESLFFMLTVVAFYYMRGHRWWIAGLAGFFAALTRVEGVLLTIPFLIEWYLQYRPQIALRWRELLAGALIPLGLFVYMAYLWVLRGDPLYFSQVQVKWDRHLAMPWVSVINAVEKIATATQGQTVANQAMELCFTLLMIGVLVGGWKRLRPSYIAYMALSILVPMSTSSLMSMPRFALVLFPMYAILARWGERPWVNNLIVAFSLPLLGLFTVLFADWYWVA
jgi:hypothetical protein